MMAEKSPKVQSKKISLCGGCTILGELPPEDPVCDSGIFCYGKQNLNFIILINIFQINKLKLKKVVKNNQYKYLR